MSDNANRERRKDRFTKNGEGERKKRNGKKCKIGGDTNRRNII